MLPSASRAPYRPELSWSCPDNQIYRFLMNGQTGTATGQAPTSWTKVLVAAGLVILFVLVMSLVAALAG